MLLEVKNLNIEYKSTKHKVISGLGFSIEEGDFLALMGPSGCGKTTLAYFMQGLNSHEMAVNGDIKMKENINIRTVFQEPSLLPWLTCIENSLFGISGSDKNSDSVLSIANELFEKFGLKNYQKYYPNKISRGMKQRINFIRAILAKPDLLILDEPFSALDRQTKTSLISYLLTLKEEGKVAIVLITHNMEEVAQFTKKIILLEKNGR